MKIREIKSDELDQLLALYTHLHETDIPADTQRLRDTWNAVCTDERHHIIVCEEGGKIVSSCVCVIIPNLTRGVRPYALIENVVTHADYRRRGYAAACLNCATEIARRCDCYKIMLLTGSKNADTLNFYQRAGFNSTDKTAFIQWL